MSPQTTLVAPLAGTVVAVPDVVPKAVSAGAPVVVIEAMKMEHEVIAEHHATVTEVRLVVGETVAEGQPLVVLDGRRECATTTRRTAWASWRSAAGCRWSCSPRAAAGARAMSTCRSWPGWTAARFSTSRSCRGWCHWWGIASGYCFAGNAALLGCCDVVIATEDASIGMGGPAMIEGGGPGRHEPAEVGPIDVQYANGVVDLRVPRDGHAVAAARRYLSYSRRTQAQTTAPTDPTLLRDLIPANRKRVYAVREVIDALLEDVLELRAGFGPGMVTALARLDGRPLGVIANDPGHLGGAIDADGADKAARFMQLCDAFGLPLLFLADTPGFMVGPEAEKTATVRHFSRMFVTGANLRIPTGTVVLRKGYGLGAQAMAAGSFKAPLFCVGWPTSEFGAMGLEGAVTLGMRRELAAIEDPRERQQAHERAVAAAYERGRGISMASYFEIDDVIDPADTRRWIATLFDETTPHWSQTSGKRRPHIDTY